MKKIENNGVLPVFKTTAFQVAGILAIVLLAVLLLWHGNATSNQAFMPLVAQVHFDGEYRIADGEWHKIEAGNHITSTKGDVTLRGNFHMFAPDGEFVGIYNGKAPIALNGHLFYLDVYNGDIKVADIP